jgi:3,5-epimerase/4-reductase
MRQFHDKRGRMLFNVDKPPFEIKQSITSISQKNVLRGLHISPYQKFIVVVTGHIFDVVVHPDGTYDTYDLKVGDSVLVGENCAHGFYSFEDSQIIYFQSGFHDPENEKSAHWDDPVLNIPWPIEDKNDLIVSVKDQNNPLFKPIDCVVLGSGGYLGKELVKYIPNSVGCDARLEDIRKHLMFLQPKYVVSAAGISGKPTIDWCETHEDKTIHTNFTLQLHLIQVCKELGIKLVIIGSGSIYDGDQFFTETDKPNSDISVYARTRIMLEETIHKFYIDDVLYLRVSYPITGDGHEKCLIEKLKKNNNNIHNLRLSVTCVPSLFPVIPNLVGCGVTGILNFVNEGSVSLPELLSVFGCEYTVSESRPTRGECKLDISRLQTLVEVEEIKTALKRLVVI